MTPEERTVLERARVATLATADAEGRPHAVPICYALVDPERAAGDSERDPRLVSAIDEKPKSTRRLRRVRDVRANPRVTVLVDHYSEDWSRLAWVQIRGRARVVSPDDGATSDPVDGDSGTGDAGDATDAESGTSDASDGGSPATAVGHDAAVAALESKYDQYADHDLRERPVLEVGVERTLSWGALAEYE